MNTKWNLFLVIMVLFLLGSSFLVPLPFSRAFFNPPPRIAGHPFGGTITLTVDCDCPNGAKLVVVGGAASGSFLKTSGTKVFARGNISPGHFILGLATGSLTPCLLNTADEVCVVPAGFGFPISIAGTN